MQATKLLSAYRDKLIELILITFYVGFVLERRLAIGEEETKNCKFEPQIKILDDWLLECL